MKGKWEFGNLGDALKKGTSNLSIKKLENQVGKYPVFGAKGEIKKVAFYHQEDEYLAIIKDGAGVGRIQKCPGKSSVLATLQYLIPTEGFDINFLFYFLNFVDFEKYKTGSTIPHIYFKDYKSEPIPLIPKFQQRRIVAILDEAFEALDQAQANVERNLANARELFQSKLNQVFSQRGEGWEEKRLGEVCENLDRLRVPITKSKRTSGEIPYYGASGVVDYVADYIFDEDLLLVSEDGANLLARTYPIAFSISGKTWVNNHAHVLRFENFKSQKFIEYYLNSIKLGDYVSGMAQPKLNQKKLNSIPVPFPSIDIQEKVVGLVEDLDIGISSIQRVYNQKINWITELKSSLLQKAFSGELTAKLSESELAELED